MIQAQVRTISRRGTIIAVGATMAFAAMTFTGMAFAAMANSELGTWKLDPAKSKTNNKDVTNVIEAAGQGVKVTVEVGAGDGSKRGYNYTVNFDGKFAPIIGTSAIGDEVSATRIDANTVKYAFKKAGKESSSQVVVVSADGKTRTQTFMNVKGEPSGMIQVFNKQ
jgi:hypothetical protein